MQRRDFVCGAAGLAGVTALGLPALAQATYSKARITKNRHSGTKKGYSYKKVKDPTGQVGGRVERFELRGGDCSRNADCKARPLNGRMVTRARVERVWETRLRQGDRGVFQYALFLPSSEYNLLNGVGSTMGQVLSAYKRGSAYNSFPLFSLDADRDGSRVYAAMSEVRAKENQKVGYREFDVGNLRRNMLDRWINVQVQFGLSVGRDGYLSVAVDGRGLGTFRGANILDDGFLEIRYGIYQTGTNQYPGGAGKVPTQVAYYANVRALKAT